MRKLQKRPQSGAGLVPFGLVKLLKGLVGDVGLEPTTR